jgi:hypothetical protein
MSEFHAKRATHEYIQANSAPPEKVFPLLCPVREAEWVPGWQYRMTYSRSGVAELGAVFTTPNEDGSETTWICSDYDPQAFRVGYIWIWPGMLTAQLRIVLSADPKGGTAAAIRYTYTGLSEEGNKVVERYDRAWFETKMRGWEQAINHYLKTGKLAAAGAWE